MVAIGIDLGTSCSCVAVWRDNDVHVIPNEEGSLVTPSYVAFTQRERLIGEPAKNQASVNAVNTIFGVKRIIGYGFYEPGLQEDLKYFPYTVLNDNGKPKIRVNYRGMIKLFAPEEISAMIIFRMKQIAEKFLGCKVDKAVITVPAYFSDYRRQATKFAGQIAGLEVIRIINEPTAAALAYGLNKDMSGEKNVLVYDLGGGTFDVSILNIGQDTVFQVKAATGNIRLGGEDFDNRIVTHLIDDVRKRHGKEVKSPRALRRLKTAAERAKRLLTSANVAVVQVESLCEGIDYHAKITRAKFERLCSDLFKDTLRYVERALVDAETTKSDINDVILVGGSTRIPKIRQMISQFFDGVNITSSVNPDEAIACGAAIQAAIVSGDTSERLKNLLLIDVLPLSLGVETGHGLMFTVLRRNTPVPCSQVREITTLEDNQDAMNIEVYEGERTLTKDNNLLGSFGLYHIPPAPRGVAKIDVTFAVDVNGILTVSTEDKTTGNFKSVTISNANRLTQQEVRKMIADAEKFREEDEENRVRLEVRNQLETYIYSAKRIMNENTEVITAEEYCDVTDECARQLTWLELNPDSMREEYERRMSELLNRWGLILRRVEQAGQRHKRRKKDFGFSDPGDP
ncbi:heat shock protein 68-like [Melitaea cinxia]|uniref:heat shock protein 68-like n=1 Tax=Melitaea cinxia TaxID=113334 RepID=UPI001E27308B|nr:heat shock protein 68-like [Melitaea cinxia]